MSNSWLRFLSVVGLLSVLGGILLGPVFLFLLLWLSGASNGFGYGRAILMAWIVFEAFFLGGGLLLYQQSRWVLRGRPSRTLRLPQAGFLFVTFLLVIFIGQILLKSELSVLLFPPLFLAGAALPPLIAMTWSVSKRPDLLTWRQFLFSAFMGGGPAVVVAALLELLLPVSLFLLVGNFYSFFQPAVEMLITALISGQVAEVINSRGFLLAIIQFAVFAPLLEEFAKPLFLLPALRRLEGPDRAFMIGASAGFGFVVVENLIYTGLGVRWWGGILAIRSFGAAIHPLGAGLVALGWYGYFRAPQDGAGHRWLAHFAAATSLHGLWNGGSLLFLALAGSGFFGFGPTEVKILDTGVGATLLALLLVLGVFGLIKLGSVPPVADGKEVKTALEITERRLALWAVLCLIAVLPLGLAAISLLGRLP